jgi:exodeoxyribonuclease V beta subunit
MKSFAILKRDQDIFGKKLIEASAGTGKTFSIEHLAVRLLLESKEIQVDQILVVTFTNAATRELKQRIRNNIETALGMLSKAEIEPSLWDYLHPFFGSKEAIQKLEEALFCFDSAQIFTIHRFCFRMLQEFFTDADFSSETQFLEGNSFEQNVFADFFRFGLHGYFPEQIDLLLRKYKSTDAILSKFSPLKNREILIDLKLIPEILEKILSECPLDADFETVSAQFREIYSEYKTTGFSKTFEEQIRALCLMVHEKKYEKNSFRTLLKEQFSLLDFLSEKNKKKASGYDPETLPPLFKWARRHIYPWIKKAVDPLLLIENFSSDALEFLEKTLKKEKKITPDFLLKKMSCEVSKQIFSDRIRKKYRAVIIDEFQDTDDLQWNIFERLFLKRISVLFILSAILNNLFMGFEVPI